MIAAQIKAIITMDAPIIHAQYFDHFLSHHDKNLLLLFCFRGTIFNFLLSKYLKLKDKIRQSSNSCPRSSELTTAKFPKVALHPTWEDYCYLKYDMQVPPGNIE